MTARACDECSFAGAYLVMTDQGEMRLCGGCLADLRTAGGKAWIVSPQILRAAVNQPVRPRKVA